MIKSRSRRFTTNLPRNIIRIKEAVKRSLRKLRVLMKCWEMRIRGRNMTYRFNKRRCLVSSNRNESIEPMSIESQIILTVRTIIIRTKAIDSNQLKTSMSITQAISKRIQSNKKIGNKIENIFGRIRSRINNIRIQSNSNERIINEMNIKIDRTLGSQINITERNLKVHFMTTVDHFHSSISSGLQNIKRRWRTLILRISKEDDIFLNENQRCINHMNLPKIPISTQSTEKRISLEQFMIWRQRMCLGSIYILKNQKSLKMQRSSFKSNQNTQSKDLNSQQNNLLKCFLFTRLSYVWC